MINNLQRVKKVIKALLGILVPSMLSPLASKWEWPSGTISFNSTEIPINPFTKRWEVPDGPISLKKTLMPINPFANSWEWPNPITISSLDNSQLKTKSEGMKEKEESAGRNEKEESDEKNWKEKDRSEQWFSNVTSGILGGFNLLGSINTPDIVSKNTNKFHNVADGLTSVANNFGPLGQALGTTIQGVKFGYDVINNAFALDTDKFSADRDVLAKAGASYNGTTNSMLEAELTAGKSHGFFDYKTFNKNLENINKAKQRLKTLRNITGKAEDLRLSVASMGEQAGLSYDLLTNGGYNQKYTYAAKQGGVLELTILEWEPEINQNIEEFKEGGLLEWEPELQKGGKIRNIDELIIYAKKENPRFIQRLSEEPKKIKFINNEGLEVEGSHYLESRGEYVIPRIQEINGELKFLNGQEAINKAIESGNYLKMDPEEAIIFAEQYKQGWPEFFKQFKNGGVVTDSLEKEETTLKNVIPEGALHKNRHHMEHAEGLTKKGIPVVDNEGNLQAEIENSEIVFNLGVTKQLEEFYKIFYSEESSNKEKELAAIDAGKLLVYEILENTDDRMGLIESCKQGGVLSNIPVKEKSFTDEDIKLTVKEVLLELINK